MSMPFSPYQSPDPGSQGPIPDWVPLSTLPNMALKGHVDDNFLLKGVERGTAGAFGWLASPVTKAVGEVEGFSLRLVNNFLNTGFYAMLAIFGAVILYLGASRIFDFAGSPRALVASRMGLR